MEKFSSREAKLKNPYQLDAHFLQGRPQDYNDPKNNILSIHYFSMMKTNWYHKDLIELPLISESVKDNSEIKGDQSSLENTWFNFKSPIIEYHAIRDMYLLIKLPKVSALEGCKVKWSKDLMLNIIRQMKIKINKTEIPQGDSDFLNFECKSNRHWSDISKNIGNRKSLIDFHNVLEEEEISLRLPFSFSDLGFPLDKLGDLDTLTFSFHLNLNPDDFLRFTGDEDLGEEKGYKVQSNFKVRFKGVYTRKSEMEIKNTMYRESDNVFHFPLLVPEKLISDDIMMSTVEFDIETKSPVDTIYWGTVNQKLSHILGSRFYATSNVKSNVKETYLRDEEDEIFNLSQHESEKVMPMLNFDNTPNEPGYNYYRYSAQIPRIPQKHRIGKELQNGKLVMKLKESKDMQPFVILNTQRLLIFKSYAKKEEERKGRSNDIDLI